MHWLRGAMLGCVLAAGPLANGQTPSPAPEAQDNPRCALNENEWDSLRKQGASGATQRSFATALPTFCPTLRSKILGKVDGEDRQKADASAADTRDLRATAERLRSENASLRSENSTLRSSASDAERRASQAKIEADSAKSELKEWKDKTNKLVTVLLRPLSSFGSDVDTAAKSGDWGAVGNIGVAFNNETGGKKKDMYAATRLYMAACDNKSAEAHCGNVGTALSYLFEADGLASVFLEKGCASGLATACNRLGWAHAYGMNGVAGNKEEGARYYRLSLKWDANNQVAKDALKALGAQP